LTVSTCMLLMTRNKKPAPESMLAPDQLECKAIDMASNVAGRRSPAEQQWFIVGSWEEYEGERRANLLRIIAIGAFYLIELINYYGLNLGFLEMPAVVQKSFHLEITLLALCWSLVGLGVLLCLRQRFFPASLKFISTGLDLILLTATLMVADGPRSPLVVGFFLVIALAALRLNLPLIWFATAGAAGGYLFALGYARWFVDRDIRVPRYHQVIFLLAVVLTGVIVGQVIRRVRCLAEDYARRIDSGKGSSL